MKYVYTILFFFLTFLSFAQSNRCFKAYNAQGQEVEVICAGERIRFKDCSGSVLPQNEYYDFDYDKAEGIPTPPDTSKFYTYDTPGIYRVLQIANTGGIPPTDTLTRVFEVKATPAPTFTAIGCGNNQVSIAITDQSYDSYEVAFGDGATAVANAGEQVVHAYPRSGTFAVAVTGKHNQGLCFATATMTITTLPAPATPYIRGIQVLVQEEVNGVIQIDAENLQTGYTYVVERFEGRSNAFIQIHTLQPVLQASSSFTITDINTDIEGIFRIRALDDCGNALATSGVLGTLVLQAAQSDEQVELNWQIVDGYAQKYALYRNGVLLADNITSTRYVDATISCGQEYCYTVSGLAPDGMATTTAASICLTVDAGAAPAAGVLLSSFNIDNHVELTLQLAGGQLANQVFYQRSIAGSPYQTIGSTQQLQHLDQGVEPNPACYKAYYTNSCDLTADASAPTCPVILRGAQPDDITLSFAWTGFVGFPDGVQAYALELLDENFQVVVSYPVTGNTYTDRSLHEDLPELRYRIKATSNSGLETFSNTLRFEQKVRLYVPTAFSPNGDGLNDLFEVKGATYSAFSLKVYHRMGNVVYSTTDAAAGWDGTHKGQQMPAGAYVYEIDITLPSGISKRRRGTVTLLR